MQYNRARQGRITSELMDVIGGVEALKLDNSDNYSDDSRRHSALPPIANH